MTTRSLKPSSHAVKMENIQTLVSGMDSATGRLGAQSTGYSVHSSCLSVAPGEIQFMENFGYTPSNICLDHPSWQFILDISKLCYSVISLESPVLPSWGDSENSVGQGEWCEDPSTAHHGCLWCLASGKLLACERSCVTFGNISASLSFRLPNCELGSD